jgi:hypothetical protein
VKLYKYRAITSADGTAFPRLSEILRGNSFWCAAPASLNDTEEFIWECDYTPTTATPALLAALLVELRGRDSATAQAIASGAISGGRIETISRPVIQSIIDQCRAEIGVACFGTSADNLVMWQRYGGDGVGVCIEIDVPDDILGNQLHRVEYAAMKRLHLDQLFQAALGGSDKGVVYSVSLLSKTLGWAAEQEVRFISRQQNISVHISGSTISRLIVGPGLDGEAIGRVQELVASLAYELPLSYHSA